MGKINYRVGAAMLAGIVVVVLGGFFVLNMSVSLGPSSILDSATRELASLFVTADDSQKEVISLQDQNDPTKPSQDREAGSSREDNLPVKSDVKTSAQSKIKFPLGVVAAPTASSPPRVLISELTTGTKSSVSDEFIEIYNPTNQVTDLSGFYIKRKATASSTENNIISKSSGVFRGYSIAPHGFFLIASKAYSGNITADVSYSQNTIFLADNSDVITLYDQNNNIIEEISYAMLARGKSWERKAYANGSCISPEGAGELLGNGCDTGNVADFVLRDIPNPQNSASGSES